VKENTLYKVKTVTNNRLSEMGFIKGTVFRVVKRIFGMLQLRFGDSNIIIREETKKDIEIEKYIK